MTKHICSIGKRSLDILYRQLRKRFDNLIWRNAVCQATNNGRDRNSRTVYARLSVMNVWIDSHVYMPVDSFHLLRSCAGENVPLPASCKHM